MFSVIVFVWFAPIFWDGFHWTVLQCTTCALTGAAAELVMETDYQIKTSFDEPERLLEVLILRLAQEARNG